MQQLSLFPIAQQKAIVNVASVPHRSPFRYPGGKTWLIPYIRRWLDVNGRKESGVIPVCPYQLVEPFAGGGIVSLTAVAEGLVKQAIMVEKDEDVAAVWLTILDGENCHWLTDEIMSFNVTYENVVRYLEKADLLLRERAFKTILKNRMNRGGILASGAGLLKNGESGKGLRSRWYPSTLKKRILAINKMQEKLTFIAGDGLSVLREYMSGVNAVFFIDPPYTAGSKKAGKRLYTHSEIDHTELFEIVYNLRGDFLMTYDDAPKVRQMAEQFRFDVECIPMKNTHHREMSELLIGRDLSWLRHLLRS